MTARERTVVTALVMAATLMQTLDGTIVNVALPHMQGSLLASPEQITWVLTSYIVSSAVATAPCGALAQRLGYKRLFLASIAGFTLASVLCGLAASLGQMVVFRVLQGIFGAALVPVSQLVMLEIYPREKHARAMALLGMAVMIGPIVGPTMGGWLTENFDWRWVFFVNVPAGIIAFVGLSATMPDTRPRRDARFDWLGFVLLSIAVGAFQLMLDRGQSKDWFGSAEIVFEAGLAALCLYLFLVQLMTARNPFLRPRLFADRNFVAGLLMIFLVGLVMFSTSALVPQFLQRLQEYPAATTGLIIAPRGIGAMLSMVMAGRLSERLDARALIAVGMVITAYTLNQQAGFTLDTSFATFAWNGALQGTGMGLVFAPLTTLAYATLDPSLRAEGTALFSLVRNVGSSTGVAITFALLDRGAQVNHAVLAEHLNPFNPALLQYLNPGSGLLGAGALALIDGEITRQATLISMLGDFRLMAILVLVSTPVVLMFRRPERSGGPQAQPVLE